MGDKDTKQVPFEKFDSIRYVFNPDTGREYYIVTLADGRKVCISDSNMAIAKELARQYNRPFKR